MESDQGKHAQQNEEAKKGFGFRNKSEKAESGDVKSDLLKLKKKELLEIMLAQSKEIDALRERVEELEKQLANREFDLSKIGSIAEASLVVTDIFKEAEKAAVIYLQNVRRSCEKRSEQHSED